jgi:hypothetical protein
VGAFTGVGEDTESVGDELWRQQPEQRARRRTGEELCAVFIGKKGRD